MSRLIDIRNFGIVTTIFNCLKYSCSMTTTLNWTKADRKAYYDQTGLALIYSSDCNGKFNISQMFSSGGGQWTQSVIN